MWVLLTQTATVYFFSSPNFPYSSLKSTNRTRGDGARVSLFTQQHSFALLPGTSFCCIVCFGSVNYPRGERLFSPARLWPSPFVGPIQGVGRERVVCMILWFFQREWKMFLWKRYDNLLLSCWFFALITSTRYLLRCYRSHKVLCYVPEGDDDDPDDNTTSKSFSVLHLRNWLDGCV